MYSSVGSSIGNRRISSLPIGEVVSEGNVGLMQAVKRFDPDKGFRLATYAM
jgi:DNA-directed RNA polymerase sigma subunit (sigma70/sigma32)